MELYLPIILDGATGTRLQQMGYDGQGCTEKWILDHPETIIEIQKGYIEAGSQIIYAPTFSANPIKLAEAGYPDSTEDFNIRLVELSRQAVKAAGAESHVLVAGDLSPTGKFVEPFGDTPFEVLLDAYTQQAKALAKAGVDIYVIETMMTLADAKAAVIAVQTVSDKPILVSFTCDTNGRTIFGEDICEALKTLQDMGVAAFGLNCSYGPAEMLEQIKKLSDIAEIPLIAKPNAGMPETVNGKTVYNCPPEEFVKYTAEFAKYGVGFFGGCCGTEADHIRALTECLRADAGTTDEEKVSTSNDCNKDCSDSEMPNSADENDCKFCGATGTPAEIFLETIKKDGKPERILKQYEALGFSFADPILSYIGNGIAPGLVVKDRWGVTVHFPEGAPGRTPVITEENKVCKDITHWRDYVKAPDIETVARTGNWEQVKADFDAIHERGQLTTILMGTGIFEECHFLMGIPDTLTNLYEHPQEMHELIDYILEYRLLYLRLLIEYAHPDAILSHDDWGTREALFMQPDVWREFFKEPYRKFYSFMRENGVIAVHHADSYMAPIVEDMAEIGIQVWQGALPENNIPQLLQQLDGRMTIMGGIGAVIDNPETTEDEARAYTREVLEECCPYGHFIPCITYGLMGTIYPQVDPFLNAEIDKYNSEPHIAGLKKCGREPDTTESVRSNAALGIELSDAEPYESGQDAVARADSIQSESLVALAKAVYSGNSEACRELSEAALAENYDAQMIISGGLVAGMTRLGDDFSAGTVFVPEMLLAAKAMKSALEVLRPHMQGDGSEAVGRAVIGTIQGDLHDIGKNLVKTMLEGSGIEVIDLGSNVPAEDFVDTAIEQNCNIICCSSLLTTTMYGMKDIVDAAIDVGIRDKVVIMVGGAPTSQEFCDEIGADIYSRDAGEAARKAVAAIKK